MNRITGRSAFLALLKDEGVTHLFGNPGSRYPRRPPTALPRGQRCRPRLIDGCNLLANKAERRNNGKT